MLAVDHIFTFSWVYLKMGDLSRMAVLGKMMMNYIEIGDGSRFPLLKWSIDRTGLVTETEKTVAEATFFQFGSVEF